MRGERSVDDSILEYIPGWKQISEESDINIVLGVLIWLSSFCDLILAKGERLERTDKLAYELPRT